MPHGPSASFFCSSAWRRHGTRCNALCCSNLPLWQLCRSLEWGHRGARQLVVSGVLARTAKHFLLACRLSLSRVSVGIEVEVCVAKLRLSLAVGRADRVRRKEYISSGVGYAVIDMDHSRGHVCAQACWVLEWAPGHHTPLVCAGSVRSRSLTRYLPQERNPGVSAVFRINKCTRFLCALSTLPPNMQQRTWRAGRSARMHTPPPWKA